MTDSTTIQRTSRIAQLAAALAAASITCILVSIVGVQWEFLKPLTSFGLFSVGAILGGALTLLLALIALFLTRGGGDRTGRRRAWASLVIGAGLLVMVAVAATPGRDAPPINDISTNPGDPPPFVAALQIPENQDRDMAYPKEFATITRKSYPDLKGVEVKINALQVLPEILEAARLSGWTVTSIDMQSGLIEATDTTSVFRFVDDIVVRIRPVDAQTTLLDVRSKSRDGRGDLGANAARIERFFYEFGRGSRQPR